MLVFNVKRRLGANPRTGFPQVSPSDYAVCSGDMRYAAGTWLGRTRITTRGSR